MNIMLVSTIERTREIGIRKALGATDEQILFQFLTEAVILTILGGLIAIGLVFGIAPIVNAKTPLELVIKPPTIVLATGTAALVGIVFGLFPAWRAARQDPVEALGVE